MKMRLVLLCLLAPSLSFGQSRDGAWFGKLDDINQLAFIAGFAEGVSVGASSGVFSSCKDLPNWIACVEARTKAESGDYSKYIVKIAPGDLHRGVKHFYSDYRNVKVNVAYAILHSGKSISGVPASELEATLEAVRRTSAGN